MVILRLKCKTSVVSSKKFKVAEQLRRPPHVPRRYFRFGPRYRLACLIAGEGGRDGVAGLLRREMQDLPEDGSGTKFNSEKFGSKKRLEKLLVCWFEIPFP